MSAAREFKVDNLAVKVYATRQEMGREAAAHAAGIMKRLLALAVSRTPGHGSSVSVIFAAAPSQEEFLAALTSAEGVDFSRVRAFHMDEYVGLRPDAPQGFGNFLAVRIFDKVPVPFRSVFHIDAAAKNPEAEAVRYGSLLSQFPPDLVCLGIGENGHIAFNDPHVADFSDPALVKVVDLDERCRAQQVNDGCFGSLEDVPTHAITLTIPALMSASSAVCTVPAQSKAGAVRRVLEGTIDESCPASILRRHPDATLYLDADSAGLLTLPR